MQCSPRTLGLRAQIALAVTGAVNLSLFPAFARPQSDRRGSSYVRLCPRGPRAARDDLTIYAPAVPRTPKISLAGIVRDATLYPAHPRAPDFRRVKASDHVASQFAE